MRTFLSLLLLAALTLTACGGGDGDGEPAAPADGTATATATATPTPTATAATSPATGPPVELSGAVNARGTAMVEGDTVAIEAGDFFFDPTYLQVDGERTFTVEVTNIGTAPHTFTIDEQEIDVSLDPGASTTVEVTYPGSGTLRFYCRFHEAQGMQGAFYGGGA